MPVLPALLLEQTACGFRRELELAVRDAQMLLVPDNQFVRAELSSGRAANEAAHQVPHDSSTILKEKN
jgi:hypothetical protein